MDKITQNKLRFVALTFMILVCSISSFSQTVIGGPYDFETGLDGWTDNGTDALRRNLPTEAYSGNWLLAIQDNSGTSSSFDSPLYSISAYDKVDFKFFFSTYDMEADEDFFIEYSSDSGSNWTIVETFRAYNLTGGAGTQGDFIRDDFSYTHYSKTVTILKTAYTFPAGSAAQFRVRCDASNDNDRIYLDYITVTGTTFATPTDGPGGINSNLDLWLRSDLIDGSTVGTDGGNINLWTDIGQGNHAETVGPGQEPVYRNNTTDNFNFNPVLEFENDHNTAGRDMTYLDTRDELRGTAGFNSNDIFMVMMPDPAITNTMFPLDTFTSKEPGSETYQEDVTGFGYGAYSQRFTGEYFTYAIGTSNGSGNGYGRTDTSGSTNYNQISIINTRHNSSNNGVELYLNANQVGATTSDASDFSAINDTKFWIGRSQHFDGSFDGRIAEIITYDSRKTDGTAERRRIESYLGLKYGITLGTNGTSMDYVDSSGTVVWDVSANSGYNNEIAGIFRDDASNHSQKQSKSVHETSDGTGLLTGILTMGITDILPTNSANTNSFPGDQQYLVWGNNGTSITAAPFTVNVDMSASIGGLSTPVTFDGMQRIWKVVETGGDVPSVKVSIPQNAVRNISPPGSYLMFISDTNIFDPTADYRVMIPDGSGNLETDYDFDGEKFITFGYAPQVIVERSIQFDGAQDYIDVGDHKDLNSAFTISAWIKRLNDTRDVTVLSKRDAGYTEGYDLRILNNRRLEMSWNGGSQSINSSVAIPDGAWHHVAIIFSGGTANLYIDGVLDTTANGMANPTATTRSFIIAAGGKTGTNDFFEGNIDEVRLWDIALSEDQLHYIMNQEIEENSNFVDGMELPTAITKNEVASIPWSDLAGYYPMSIYTYTNTNDHSDNQNQGALRNLNTVDFQTAPLPYESTTNGNWTSTATWLNGSVNIIPGSPSIVDNTVTVDWNIVETNHNITMNNASLPTTPINISGNLTNIDDYRSVLGLTVNSNELTVDTDQGLSVTHYLNVDGLIDLVGEAQLIQTDGSDLDVTSGGSLERDQQGTADNFTYNYWSSPVSTINTTSNNASYTIPSLVRDGTTPATPGALNFITTGFDGTAAPVGVADYWIWKFANRTGNDATDYSYWQHIRSTGTMLVGEGYTMKGPGTGGIATPQNYVYTGKPNNGDVSLTITAGNDYLVGNPYPSAIDSHEFLNDNPLTGGTLYYWEHWGGGSHYLADYQGGYAQYNYSGGTGAGTYGTNDPDVNAGGTPTKRPAQFIPVAQGFFVVGTATGTVNFENDQRQFIKESVANSVFVRKQEENSTLSAANTSGNSARSAMNGVDTRKKFRIGFNSVNQIHRQLLLTVDENASVNVDWGYDGKLIENQIDDMYWMIENDKYIIQGTNLVDNRTIAPLGVHTRDAGMNSFTIDELENVPADAPVYLYDKILEITHNLRESDYTVFLTAGEHLDRFDLIFNDEHPVLDVGENELADSIQVFYILSDKNLVIVNPKQIQIDGLEIFSILGQSLETIDDVPNQLNTQMKIHNLSAGTYIVKLSTETGTLSKQILVK